MSEVLLVRQPIGWIEDFPFSLTLLWSSILRHLVSKDKMLESELHEVEQEAENVMGCFEFADFLWISHLLDVCVLEILVRPVQVGIEIFSCYCSLFILQQRLDEEHYNVHHPVFTFEIVQIFLLHVTQALLHGLFQRCFCFLERTYSPELRILLLLCLKIVPHLDFDHAQHIVDWLRYEV